MFYIPPDARDAAIDAMRAVLLGPDASGAPDVPRSEYLSQEHVAAAFDAAVEVVFRRMGLAR